VILKKLVLAISSIAIFSLIPSSLLAQTVLDFPRVISNGSLFTGLAVGNPTPAEVSVTFTAYQANGALLAGDGIQNPITLRIPAGGQLAKLTGEIFGNRDFNGWVEAASSARGLTGFFLNGNALLTDLDGSGATEASAELVLPLASAEGATKTELTILNPNTDAAAATVTLYAAGGQTLATRDVTLAGRSLIRQTLQGIFGNRDFSGASHVKVRSDRELVGQEVVADFQIPGSTVGRETMALGAFRPSAATRYVLPQFATGGGWLSLVGLVNAAGLGQEITLTAYKEDGTLWNVPSNPKRIALDANGGLRTTAQELFGFSDDTFALGWIEVQSPLGFLSSYIGFGNTLTPSFAAVAGTETTAASRYEVFSQVAEGAGYFTGLTVVNPGRETAVIEFYTLRADGTTVGRSTFNVGPNQRVGKLFSELLPASLDQVGGWGFLRSSQPVIGAVLFGSTNGFALANVPQQVPAGDFIPPAQTTGAITGAVRAAGEPIGEVEIRIAGPVNTTRMTDGLGRYTFGQLPPGDYKITATRTDAQFVPATRALTLDRQNIDGVNFEAGGLIPAAAPAIQFLSPVSTFAGTRAFSLRVLGGNFTPASVVRVNDQPIPTTFINPGELQAIIPATQLIQPATVPVTVETPAPGGGVSGRLEFTINALPKDPLIEGRAAVGAFPAGVAVDAGRGTVLITNQSSDSVSVVNLKTLQTNTNIKVGRSPAEGIAVDTARAIAVVANPGSNSVSVIDLKTNQVTKEIPVGSFPIGVAINTRTGRALVANGQSDSVSVLNLDTLTVIAQIPVGVRPSGIAIQAEANQAVVADSSSNTVSIIDLTTNAVIGTVPVGQFPRGVAIDAAFNMAVVANANSNDVSVIDLSRRVVVFTTKVETGPTGVASHALTGNVIITNSGVVRGSQNFAAVGTATVLNLGTREIVATIPVGSAAFGVDVDHDHQSAVVANFGSNDITVIRIPNPRPRVDSVEPKTFPAGAGAFTVTVRGAGFVPASVVTLNRQPLPTSYISPLELRAQISAATLNQLLQVQRAISADTGKGGTFAAVQELQFDVSVTNPQPGGGDAPPSSDPQASRIAPENALPVLVSVTPTDISAGTTDLTLTLSGNNFNGTSIISFGGALYSPSSSSNTIMTVTIPRGDLTAGTKQVVVTNPAPGGGTSAAKTFTVFGQVNPAPVIAQVNPSSIQAGSAATTVTIEGTGFITTTVATLAEVSGTVSGNTIQFQLPVTAIANAVTLNGLVTNPQPGGGSASFHVSVLNGKPAISGFTPATADAGTAALSLVVKGTNFYSGTQITVEGTPVPTEFESATSLKGTLGELLLRRPGQVRIGVTNPPPGGGTADGGLFTINNPVPAITSLAPSTAVANQDGQQITIHGSGFIPASRVQVNGAPAAATYVDPATLTFALPVMNVPSAPVQVSNPIPGGGPSNTATLQFSNVQPAITILNPSSAAANSVVTLSVTGSSFVNGATIKFDGLDVPTTFISNGVLSAILTLGSTPGSASVTVTNPGGATSNSLTF
jgi:YVTN family beta-propeller protein